LHIELGLNRKIRLQGWWLVGFFKEALATILTKKIICFGNC